MNKMIVVSGVNGCGKSTTVKNYLLNGKCETDMIPYDGKRKLPLTIDHSRKIIALGDYLRQLKFPGSDQYHTKDELLFAIEYVMKNFEDYSIIVEGTQTITTLPFNDSVMKLCKQYDYIFKFIYLYCDYDNIEKRLKTRNANAKINEKNVKSLFKRFENLGKQVPITIIDNNQMVDLSDVI